MTYHVTATRQGRGWELRCDELPTVFSFSTRLDQAEDTVREAIAFVAEVPEDSFTVEVSPELPPAFLEEKRLADHARELAATAKSEAALHSRAAAKALAGAGLPARDIGEILGVSYQRAHQLVSA